MKKTLALIMTLAMVLSCVVGLAVNTSAAELEWVEESYSYKSALEEVGTHGDGAIEILSLQAEGGKRMAAAAYLLGHSINF